MAQKADMAPLWREILSSASSSSPGSLEPKTLVVLGALMAVDVSQ